MRIPKGMSSLAVGVRLMLAAAILVLTLAGCGGGGGGGGNSSGTPTSSGSGGSSGGGSQAATVTSMSVDKGTTAGGTNSNVQGTNFKVGAVVLVGGNPATVAGAITSTSIPISTPAGTAGAASVSVTNPGESTVTLAGAFTYMVPPTGTQVDHPVVPLAGMQIVVTFLATDSVDAGQVNGSAVGATVNNGNHTATFTVPPGTAGPVSIALGNNGVFGTPFQISRRGATIGNNDGSPAKNLVLNGAVSTLTNVAGAFNLRFFANGWTPFLYVTIFGAGTLDRILTTNGNSLGTTTVTGGVLRNADVDRDGNLVIAQGTAAQSISRAFIAAATASATLVGATGVDTYCIAFVQAALAANDTYWQGSLTNGTLTERLASSNATGRTANIGATSLITGMVYDDEAKVLWVFDQSTGIVSAVELQFTGLPIVPAVTTGLSNGADLCIVAGSDIIAIPNRDSADARTAAFSLSAGTLIWNQGASQAGVSIRSVQIVTNKIFWTLSNGDIIVAQIQ